LSIIKRFPI